MTAALPTKTNAVVEIFYSAAWHGVPVYTRDEISITGAVPNFGAVSSPATCTLSIQNTSGLYSPENAAGDLYGLIGQNTPIQVTVDGEILFSGEIETWTQRWEQRPDVDKWAAVVAYGISRRLNKPGVQAPEFSALARAHRSTGILTPGLLAYYSLEEEVDADAPVSGVSGVDDLVLNAGVTLGAARDVQNGSLPYAVLDGSVATALTPAFQDVTLPSSSAGFFAFGCALKGTMPRLSTAKAVIYQASRVYFSGGNITDAQIIVYAKWTGTAFDATNCGVDVILTGGTSFGSVVGGVGNFNLFDGLPHDVQVRMTQSGADVVGELYIDGTLADDATSTTKTLGTPLTLVGPYVSIGSLGGTAADMIDTTFAFGHYAINTDSTVGTFHDAAIGHVGEPAAERLERTFTEDGVPIVIVGTAADSELMGPQIPGSLMAIASHCLEVDQGLLFDTRDALSVTYRTIKDLYNQDVALPLVMNAGGHVAHPLDPVTDTQNTLNDVTVQRFQGGARRVVQETGPRNVQEPTVDPQGVGRYPRKFRLFLAADSQAGSQAGWRVHAGTTTDPRFPAITLDLAAMVVDGLSALKAAALALGVGDRVTVANLPETAGPDAADQLMLGYAHTIKGHQHLMVINAGAAGPYEVFELESTTGNRGRLSPGIGSTTTEALTTTETLIDITSAVVRWIDSTNYAAMFPFDIVIAGERMTVTEITGTTLSQTMRVTRSVNGIVKTHPLGSVVALFRPAVLAL